MFPSRRLGYFLLLPLLIIFIVYLFRDLSHILPSSSSAIPASSSSSAGGSAGGEDSDDSSKAMNYVAMSINIGGIMMCLLSLLNLSKLSIIQEEEYHED